MNTENQPMNDTRPTPRERAYSLMNSRLEDLRAFNSNNYDPEEMGEPEYYGLSLDMVEAGTFENQFPFIRFQISWGGPSEEFRFYSDGKTSFVFMDWGEFEEITLYSDDRETVETFLMIDEFKSFGNSQYDHMIEYGKAMIKGFSTMEWAYGEYTPEDDDE